MSRLVFDIEGDNLYQDITKVHCIRAYDLDTDTMHRFDVDNEPIFRGIKLLNEADILIGHNIIGFDRPALHKLYPKFTAWKGSNIFDTIIGSKLICATQDRLDMQLVKQGKLPSNLIGSHSLKAWGYRLEEFKGEYGERHKGETDEEYHQRVWANYSREMADYCEQDVLTNVKLYKHLMKEAEWRQTPQRAIDIEHKFATIISRQERHGVKFDINKAESLEKILRKEAEEALETLRATYKPKWFIDKPAKGKGVTIEVDGVEYYDIIEAKVNRRKKIECPITGKVINSTNALAGSLRQDIHLETFNPNSGTHVIRWLTEDFGWQPTEFTEAGTPKTDADTLAVLTFEGIELLQRYQMLLKRLSQLADGKSALLKRFSRDTCRIYGRCDTLGAVTRRCTHSAPNLAQVPSNTAEYGKNFRELFTVSKGYTLVGADASGLELRTLAHYLSLFDGGEYAKVVLNGDIHWKNCMDAGFIEQGTIRDKHNDYHDKVRGYAKTFIYAMIYGAGAMKLGEIVCPNGSREEKERAGKNIKNQFMKSNQAMAKLIDAIKQVAKDSKYVIDLDGNPLYIRSEHSAPNLVLQSCGAIVMKYWAVAVDEALQDLGYENTDDVMHTDRKHDYENVLNIHDEAQLEVRDTLAEEVAEVMQSMFNTVGLELEMNIPIDGESKVGTNWSETH